MSGQSEGTPLLPEVDFLSEAAVPSNSVEANSTELEGTAVSEIESPLGRAGVNSLTVEALLTTNFNFECNNVRETSVTQQHDFNNQLGIHPPSACQERDRNATGDGSLDDFDHFSLSIFIDNNETSEHSNQLVNLAFNDDIASDLIDIDNDSLFADTRIDATHGEPDDHDGLIDLTLVGPPGMHADELAADAVREIDSGDSIHRASTPHLVERRTVASTDVVGSVQNSSIMQGTSSISACAHFGRSHESAAETFAANDDGSSAVDSTASDRELRTVTNRYSCIGRGPQKCGTCGVDRRGHNCPFKQWNSNKCKKIRVEWLAAEFYGLSGTLGSQESIVLSDEPTSTEQLESSQENAGLIQCHDVAAGTARSNESERHCESEPTAVMHPNKTNRETRTISQRYNAMGRGEQKCGLCGLQRKKHCCIFPNSATPASAQDFINEKTVEALAIGLCLGERINSNSIERRNSNNGNQSEVTESEVSGQESQDEMENSDSGKVKRQRQK